jgi:hypothetical protein
MQKMNQKEWKEILTKVFKRAATDHEFHALCLSNAREAIKQVSGKEVPEELRIRFVDQTDEIVFMLPAVDIKKGEQLSPEQLEMLAGGMSILPLNLNLGASDTSSR